MRLSLLVRQKGAIDLAFLLFIAPPSRAQIFVFSHHKHFPILLNQGRKRRVVGRKGVILKHCGQYGQGQHLGGGVPLVGGLIDAVAPSDLLGLEALLYLCTFDYHSTPSNASISAHMAGRRAAHPPRLPVELPDTRYIQYPPDTVAVRSQYPYVKTEPL